MVHTWARVVERASDPDREQTFLLLEGRVTKLVKESGIVVMRLSLVGSREQINLELSLRVFSKKIRRQLLRGGVRALLERNWFRVRRVVDEGKIYLRANRHRR